MFQQLGFRAAIYRHSVYILMHMTWFNLFSMPAAGRPFPAELQMRNLLGEDC